MSWGHLVKSGAPNGMGSMPKNPKCAVHTDGCSEALLGDVCVWHSCRMGSINHVGCGCKTNLCVNGDSPGRKMRRDYEIKKAEDRGETLTYEDFAVIDSFGHYYCCGSSQNADSDIALCGDMRVCTDCAPKHSKLEYYHKQNSSDEEIPDHWLNKPEEPVSKVDRWQHHIKFLQGDVDRQNEYKHTKLTEMEPTGPVCWIVKDGIWIKVDSAITAFNAAKDAATLEEMEWWTWFAGWFMDCPASLRHF